MARKALIPEEKWEGLRRAMEAAAGTRKATGTPGDDGSKASAGGASRPVDEPKRKAKDEKGKEGKESGKAEKKRKRSEKEKEGKKGKRKGKKKGKKGKRGKKGNRKGKKKR